MLKYIILKYIIQKMYLKKNLLLNFKYKDKMESMKDQNMKKHFKLTDEQIRRIDQNMKKHFKLSNEQIRRIDQNIIENKKKEIANKNNKRKNMNEDNRKIKKQKIFLDTPEKISKRKKMIEDWNNLQRNWRFSDIEKSKLYSDLIFKNQILEHPTAESLIELYNNDGDSLWNFEYYMHSDEKYRSLIVFNFIKNGYKYTIHIHNDSFIFTSQEKLKRLVDCCCWNLQFFIQKNV